MNLNEIRDELLQIDLGTPKADDLLADAAIELAGHVGRLLTEVAEIRDAIKAPTDKNPIRKELLRSALVSSIHLMETKQVDVRHSQNADGPFFLFCPLCRYENRINLDAGRLTGQPLHSYFNERVPEWIRCYNCKAALYLMTIVTPGRKGHGKGQEIPDRYGVAIARAVADTQTSLD